MRDLRFLEDTVTSSHSRLDNNITSGNDALIDTYTH